MKNIKLPEKEQVLKEADKQIKDWLESSTEREKLHYKVGFRRCYEYILRINK
jgi:hypothetical protein